MSMFTIKMHNYRYFEHGRLRYNYQFCSYFAVMCAVMFVLCLLIFNFFVMLVAVECVVNVLLQCFIMQLFSLHTAAE